MLGNGRMGTSLFLTSPELCEDCSVGYKEWPGSQGACEK